MLESATNVPKSAPVSQRDRERLHEFDFLRATEGAALHSLQWVGKGDKESADAAACDAIRGMFDLMDVRGEIVIGEGIKDEAPGLFRGERIGLWRPESVRFDIAVDPIDGTTNLSKGLPNAISCIAAACRDDSELNALQEIPAFYLHKLAYPAEVRAAFLADPKLPIDINAPITDVIKTTARILDKGIRDVVVMVLDRPRNNEIVEAIRRIGASLRMIGDGDITAALAPAMKTSSVDLYAGIGGAPEGVLSAAALRCLGGGMQAKVWPRDEAEKASLVEAGWGDKLDQVYLSKDLARGDGIMFCATGILDSPLLRGIEVRGSVATTHSLLLRVKSGTVRYVTADHDLTRKTIRLRSTQTEVGL